MDRPAEATALYSELSEPCSGGAPGARQSPEMGGRACCRAGEPARARSSERGCQAGRAVSNAVEISSASGVSCESPRAVESRERPMPQRPCRLGKQERLSCCSAGPAQTVVDEVSGIVRGPRLQRSPARVSRQCGGHFRGRLALRRLRDRPLHRSRRNGRIYRAEHEAINIAARAEGVHRRVLRAVRPGRNRFLREARRAATIRHPERREYLRRGRSGGLPYLVMERLDGEDLDALLRSGARSTRAPSST